MPRRFSTKKKKLKHLFLKRRKKQQSCKNTTSAERGKNVSIYQSVDTKARSIQSREKALWGKTNSQRDTCGISTKKGSMMIPNSNWKVNSGMLNDETAPPRKTNTYESEKKENEGKKLNSVTITKTPGWLREWFKIWNICSLILTNSRFKFSYFIKFCFLLRHKNAESNQKGTRPRTQSELKQTTEKIRRD